MTKKKEYSYHQLVAQIEQKQEKRYQKNLALVEKNRQIGLTQGVEAQYKALSKAVNQRIVRLERAFGSAEASSAYANLKAMLNQSQMGIYQMTRDNRTRSVLDKSLNAAKTKYVIKAMESFLTAKTSEVVGLKDTRKKITLTLHHNQNKLPSKLTIKEAQSLSSVIESAVTFKLVEEIGASTLSYMTDYADEKNMNLEEYIKLLVENSSINIEDVEIKINIYSVYSKEIAPLTTKQQEEYQRLLDLFELRKVVEDW